MEIDVGTLFFVVMIICLILLIVAVDLNSFKTFVLGFVIFVITIGIILITASSKNVKTETYSTEYIICLNDNNNIYGSRYHIGEQLYYQYMVKLSNGGYVSNKVNADKTTIYMDNSTPRVEWIRRTSHWFIFSSEMETRNKIYIPEGSIISDYNIDCE